jgi:transcriptional regulator with XRE-family HTH domain
MSFRENLKKELFYNDIKTKELARKINVPYTTTLAYLDKRGVIPNAEIAVRIAKVLNVTVEYLVTGKEEVRDLDFKKKYPILNPLIDELLSLPKPLLTGVQNFIHILYMNSKFL